MTDAETPRGKAADTTAGADTANRTDDSAATRTRGGEGAAPDSPQGEAAGTEGGGKAGRKRGRTPYRYVRGYQGAGGDFAPTNTHRGRLGSWVAVAVFMAGFIAGGLGIVFGLNWWWIGGGLAAMAVGGVLFLVTDIFTDVVLDDPHRESEEPHNTPLHRIKSSDRRVAETQEGHRAAADDRSDGGRPDLDGRPGL